MAKSYPRDFKKEVVELINIHGHSTIKTAREFDIPLKTLEKWITAYNKNNRCFDPVCISEKEHIKQLETENKKLKQINDVLKHQILEEMLEFLEKHK